MTDEAIKSVQLAIEDIRSGKMVIMTDDDDRENEGDLVLAAQFATPESINFMATHGKGLICLSLSSKLIDKLELPMMASQNQAKYSTAFTVSVESREGISTGISAHDRAHTIQTCIKENATRQDIVTPGHVFPLRAEDGGVLVRAGHTEGSVDIASLAGLKSAAVICEILKEDGTMARVPDLEVFAKKHDLKILSIADLIEYRLRNDASLIEEMAHKEIKENLSLKIFSSKLDSMEHLAFVKGGKDILSGSKIPSVRVHVEDGINDWSAGITDNKSWTAIQAMLNQEEAAVLVVLRSRSIAAKLSKEDNSANDLRTYGLGAQILRSLGVNKMNLVSRSPDRHIVALDGFGIEVANTFPLEKYL